MTYFKTFEYPKTKKSKHIDTYFSNKISDPYDWLENTNSKESNEWINLQNQVTSSYLSSIPYRDNIKEALTSMLNYPNESTPWKEVGKYFFYKNNGLQNHSVLYVKDNIEDTERILIDPNSLSEDGTISLDNISFSKDGKYIAYQLSNGGSDWSEIHVKTLDGKDLADTIKWVKLTIISWYKDGFFYGGYDEPKEDYLLEQNKNNKLYYHKIGTKQTDDILIYENKEDPFECYDAWVPDEEKYIVLNVYKNTSENNILIRSLDNLVDDFITVVDESNSSSIIIDNIEDDFYMLTNVDAPNWKIVKFNASMPKIVFEDVILEEEDVLQNAFLIGGKIITEHLHNATSKLSVYSITGQYESDIHLPSLGNVTSITGNKKSNEMFYSFESFSTPNTIYKVDISTLNQQLYRQTNLPFIPSNYICEQVFYTSKDGTTIPMFITYKEGINKNGNNPLLMYGYGGFNMKVIPSFSINTMLFLENGGIYATPNLRGGGEFGDKWHEAGVKLQKQNVFDDFIAAAEYLINENYTSSHKLAIQGASNGGLLVGACITQRPDLFKVALPSVGLMDMLKFHKFTIGYAWINEYGSSDDEEEFNYLLKYSPLHNVKDNTVYPATLITTGECDDRVVPAHSFKFVAEMQSKCGNPNPALIRVESLAGHGGKTPLNKEIEELADQWAFTFYNLGISYTNPLSHKCFDNQVNSNKNFTKKR